MPTFILHRDRPLQEEEWSHLPRGCEVVTDGSDVIARADVDGPLLELLHFVALLARAIPDARLVIRQTAAVLDLGAGAPRVAGVQTLPTLAEPSTSRGLESATSSSEVPADPALLREDPWELMDRGEVVRAEQRFALGFELDMAGRDRVRDMFNSTDPATCALGCRLAGYTNWKSFVTTLRKATEHADVRVRRDAVTSIGKLAGPAMVPVIEARLKDPSPEVQQAAREALIRISSREPLAAMRRR